MASKDWYQKYLAEKTCFRRYNSFYRCSRRRKPLKNAYFRCFYPLKKFKGQKLFENVRRHIIYYLDMFWVVCIVIFPKFQISLGLHPRCTPYQIRFFKFSDNFPTSLDSFQLIQKLFFPTTLSHYTCPFFPISIELSIFYWPF